MSKCDVGEIGVDVDGLFPKVSCVDGLFETRI